MDVREVMNRKEGYYAGYSPIYDELQKKAKRLCCEYNMTFPEEEEKRIKILKIFSEHIIPLFLLSLIFAVTMVLTFIFTGLHF